MIQVTHHRRKCIGCGYCAEQAPEAFAMSRTDGKASLLAPTQQHGLYWQRFSDTYYDALACAADGCPVHIIQLRFLARK